MLIFEIGRKKCLTKGVHCDMTVKRLIALGLTSGVTAVKPWLGDSEAGGSLFFTLEVRMAEILRRNFKGLC